MSLKKRGVTVDCARCEYRSSHGRNSFEVSVPIGDIETGVNGTAALLCSIHAARHEVKLKEWNDAQGRPIRPPAQTQKHVEAVLGELADEQICGNYQICPTEVVEIVEKLSRRS